MVSKITLANAKGEDVVLHELTGTRGATSIQGLEGIGALRESKRVRPSAHGSLNETSYEEGRLVQLVLEVSGTSMENTWEEFRHITQVMLETLDQGPALLKWTEGTTGLKLQMLVKLDSQVEPIVLGGVGTILTFPVSFFAADPRAYAQAQLTAKGTGITGTATEATFLKTTNKAVAVCVDAGHIYWVDGVVKAIGRATLAGGTIENEWVKVTGGAPTALAIDAAHVYWGHQVSTNSFVGRCTIAGATIEEEFLKTSKGTGTEPKALAVNASFIYYGIASANRIGRGPIAGGTGENFWLTLPAGSTANALTLDATWVYYSTGSAIGRIKLGGEENAPTWIAGVAGVTGLAVNATFIYWNGATARSIGRAKLAGTEVNTAFISGLETAPAGLAVNTEHLYWGEASSFLVRSKELAGGGPVGSEVKVKNAGNRPAPLTFKIVGPILNPSVVRKSDGARITLRGEITSGNFAEINTADRTVKLNGTTNLLEYLDPSSTNWAAFQAPVSPNEEAYTLTGSTATAATLEVLYLSAYA